MFKQLLALVFGSVRERNEAEEAYEREFGVPPMRGMTTRHIKRRVEQHKAQPMAIRKRRAPQPMVQDDPLLNPANPAYLATHQPYQATHHSPVSTHRSHDPCDDYNTRHHGGYDSHHSSSSYDSGSSDSGSSNSGGCD